MAFDDYALKETRDFRGPWTKTAQVRTALLGAKRGMHARNVEYSPGLLHTREGFSVAYVSAKTWSIHSWFNELYNKLLILDSSQQIQHRDITAGTIAALFPGAGGSVGLSIAEAGDRLYIAQFSNDPGVSLDAMRVWDPALTVADTAFGGTSSLAPTYADVGAGNLTAGLHIVGYVVETRSGFLGLPNPRTGANVFAQPSIVTLANRSWQATLGPFTVPDDWVRIHPIMSTTTNLVDMFFVGDPITVPAGTIGHTATWLYNETDALLADSSRSADLNFDLLAQTVLGLPPFVPCWVATYGDRLAIHVGTGSAKGVYFSEPFDYQTITAGDHLRELPGNRVPVTGAQLRGSYYVFGRSYTYEFYDNKDLPSTWPTPREVSSAIGTPSPFGIEWRTNGDYFWVASQKGLFLFNGGYTDKPISYYQEDFWKRINFATQSGRVKVRDWTDKQMVLVAAALDGATELTHILCWNYSRGLTPEAVDFSYWDIAGGRTFGTIELYTNESKLPRLLIGPSGVSTQILVNNLAFSSIDEGIFTPSSYETGFLLEANRAGNVKRQQTGALEMLVSGLGALSRTLYGIDKAKSLSLASLTLNPLPGEAILNQPYMIDENFTLRIEVTAPGIGPAAYFSLSKVGLYVKPFADRKG